MKKTKKLLAVLLAMALALGSCPRRRWRRATRRSL